MAKLPTPNPFFQTMTPQPSHPTHKPKPSHSTLAPKPSHPNPHNQTLTPKLSHPNSHAQPTDPNSHLEHAKALLALVDGQDAPVLQRRQRRHLGYRPCPRHDKGLDCRTLILQISSQILITSALFFFITLKPRVECNRSL